MLQTIFYADPVLIAAAVIPAVILLIRVYKVDKLEKESPRMLASLVLLGILATLLAGAAEGAGMALLNLIRASYSVLYFLLCFAVIGLSEEGFKYLFLNLRTWKSPEFNCQFDAIVYSVFLSLGFALWENIVYVIGYGFQVALLRAVTAIPGHACFGVFMGVFYGMARRAANNGQTGQRRLLRVIALLVPVLLHGEYDYLCIIKENGKDWIFIVFIAVLFVISFILVRKMSSKDRMI